MRLLVLAGGFGTRLKTSIADVPKALAPIGDVPFLQLQIDHWLAQGIREFTFLLHHKASEIISFLEARKSGLLNGCKVNWLIEPVPMDTGGAIAYAVQVLDIKGDFLITNADTWLGGGVHELIKTVAPAMAVINVPDVNRYGQVLFDDYNRVTVFMEKNVQTSAGWINAGFCHLSAGLFHKWNGSPFSLERELFPTLVKNQSLTVIPLRTDFIDIGVPDDYHRFCLWIESDRTKPLCN